jgi:hypothetical protein
MNTAANNPRYISNIRSNNIIKPWLEFALMTAAHILVCLTKEGKTHKEIAREDFDNNLELVSVWIDYMTAINWMYKNTNYGSSNNKWIAIDSAKKWVERILQYNKEGKQLVYPIMLLNVKILGTRHDVLNHINSTWLIYIPSIVRFLCTYVQKGRASN